MRTGLSPAPPRCWRSRALGIALMLSMHLAHFFTLRLGYFPQLMAAPLLVYSAPARLKGKDVIWFLDNASAETALVKAGSPAETMCFLALVANAALGGLGATVWYDHVDTDDNPADVLSRAGLEDPVVLSNVEFGVWDVVKVVEPDVTTLDFHRPWQCRA